MATIAVPPLPEDSARRKNRTFLLIVAVVVILSLSCIVAFRSIITSGITRSVDNKFGDQSLKTAVALIELHKLRYGKYPDSLRDLKFLGEWDQGVVLGVYYQPSPNRDAYYIEVERGWMGKPDLRIPPEFWKGTGYSKLLKPGGD